MWPRTPPTSLPQVRGLARKQAKFAGIAQKQAKSAAKHANARARTTSGTGVVYVRAKMVLTTRCPLSAHGLATRCVVPRRRMALRPVCGTESVWCYGQGAVLCALLRLRMVLRLGMVVRPVCGTES
eukprot:438980-Rhodomonas_salina.1